MLNGLHTALANDNQVFRCIISKNGLSSNPTSSYIEIEMDKSLVGSDYQIISLKGQTVMKGKLKNAKTRIYLDDLAPADYTFNVSG